MKIPEGESSEFDGFRVGWKSAYFGPRSASASHGGISLRSIWFLLTLVALLLISIGLYLLTSGPSDVQGLSIVLTIIGTVAAVVQAVIAYLQLTAQRKTTDQSRLGDPS
jgi:hypothetical protein